jgi:hypothetical protein
MGIACSTHVKYEKCAKNYIQNLEGKGPFRTSLGFNGRIALK